MRLYTKTGDRGETGLIDGSRVSKDHPRVSAYGELDELNASIALAMVACEDDTWRSRMSTIQDCFFVLGAELANPKPAPDSPTVGDDDVKLLERWIDAATEEVAPLKAFIFPGGCELAARLHMSRTVCRRAERNIVALARDEQVSNGVVIYVNRLADLLFVWARLANKRAGVKDVTWRSPGS